MKALWRMGVVITSGWVAFILGVSLPWSIGLGLFCFFVLVRREVIDSIFPLRAFRERCLSIRGLETDPSGDEAFRRALATAIYKTFPDHRPTACCCFVAKGDSCEATLILHRKRGHLPFRVSAPSQSLAVSELISAVDGYRGYPFFSRGPSGLQAKCRDCRLRKAHRLVGRNLPQVNPLSQSSKSAYFATRIRSLNH